MAEKENGEDFGCCVEGWDRPSNSHGGTHDIYMCFFGVNARMHYVDVGMGIGTLVYLLVMFNCIMKNLVY
jgi:hypothetical protein